MVRVRRQAPWRRAEARWRPSQTTLSSATCGVAARVCPEGPVRLELCGPQAVRCAASDCAVCGVGLCGVRRRAVCGVAPQACPDELRGLRLCGFRLCGVRRRAVVWAASHGVRRRTPRRDLRRRAARVPDGLRGLGLCALR